MGNVAEFVEKWRNRGNEKSNTQSFWLTLLRDCFEVPKPEEQIVFEMPVKIDGSTKYLDAYIARNSNNVLIEQKSLGIPLDKPQPGHDNKTPFQQAKEYFDKLPLSKKPRWIITCNFSEFWVYDMNCVEVEKNKQIIRLDDLPKELYRLNFLDDADDTHIQKELEVSVKAGEAIGEIYDLLRKRYHNPDAPETLRSLNILCVRLVFCFYAEDAGIFHRRNQFSNYFGKCSHSELRTKLRDFFTLLNTKEEERDSYLKDDQPELAAFPYVNGGLFEDKPGEEIEIPPFTEQLQQKLFNAGSDLDWSGISPTIFGAIFESTLSSKRRREGGMHYTSIENIHKVIDPLFLEDFEKKFFNIRQISDPSNRLRELHDFQQFLATRTFLDVKISRLIQCNGRCSAGKAA